MSLVTCVRRIGAAPEGLPPYLREWWAERVAVGKGPEAGLLREPTWAGAINREDAHSAARRPSVRKMTHFGQIRMVRTVAARTECAPYPRNRLGNTPAAVSGYGSVRQRTAMVEIARSLWKAFVAPRFSIRLFQSIEICFGFRFSDFRLRRPVGP